MKRIPAAYRTGVFTALALIAVQYALDLPAAEPGHLPAPAKIDRPVKEAELATITLTAEAERRLGIAVAPVEQRKLARTRFFGGEVIVPAQSAGKVAAASGPRNGGQSVFAILPALSPAEQVRLAQAQIDADGQVEQARVQWGTTRQALHRAEQMLRDKVGTGRAMDDARAQVNLAEAGLRTARARRDLLGPALLDVSSPAKVWVRVAVYAGDLAKLNWTAGARVGGLADAPGAAGRAAAPVSAPPSANAAAATVDVFYQMPNQDGAFRLGQRVGVTVPLRDDEAVLAAPWSAIVHDAGGGTWVYERAAPAVYVRRRVRVERVVGDWTALSGDVQVDANVVTTGAAELFGTEFGAGK